MCQSVFVMLITFTICYFENETTEFPEWNYSDLFYLNDSKSVMLTVSVWPNDSNDSDHSIDVIPILFAPNDKQVRCVTEMKLMKLPKSPVLFRCL